MAKMSSCAIRNLANSASFVWIRFAGSALFDEISSISWISSFDV